MEQFRYLLAAMLFFTTHLLYAQTGDVRGFVYDQESGEPIIFTNVYLEGTTHAAATDINGFYSINRIPVGNYTLISTFIGYDTTRVNIAIKSNEIINQKLFIKKRELFLQEVEISSKKEEKQTEVRTSAVKITPKQITKLPSIGGEPDLAQYLQILPGIVSTGDQGGQLYIRGGSPIQTRVMIDGMTIYNPFHSLGLFSVIETDMLRNVEVFTGGYNANYGGRISAIIDATTRDGNKKRFGGKVSANTFTAKAILEGPIVRLKEGEDALSSSYIVTAKTSYLDKTSPTLYNYVDTAGLPYSFTDIYGKLNFTTNNGSKLNFSAFRFDDDAVFQNLSEYGWTSWGGGSSFVLVPGQSKNIIDGYFSYSTYDISLREADAKPRTSSIGGFNGGINFTNYFPRADFKYGIEVSGYTTQFQFYNPIGIKIEENQYTTEIGGFMEYHATLGKKNQLVLEPGLRVNYYASLSSFALEPRFGMKWNISDAWRFKAAAGIYTQNFISTKSDRDIVNLFTGFLTGPEQSLKGIDGKPLPNNQQRATHFVAGIETDIAKGFDVNVEGYYKKFGTLIEINRSKLFASDPNYQVEEGEAYGIDVLAKYDYKRWFLWAAYSFSFVNRNDGEQIYPTNFDRRHNLNCLASYTFGKSLDWELSLRWNLGSGFPFTYTQGFYENLDLTGNIDDNHLDDNGSMGVLLDETINAGRLPYYHRFDASLRKEFAFGANTKLEVSASVTNIYDRKNIFYVNRITSDKIYQLPILPSIGVGLNF
jgi:hypothetical protein